MRGPTPRLGTRNRRTLPLSATGSAGMEAAFVNTVEEGDVVVAAVNGLFGERMCDVAARCGVEVVRVDFPYGRPVDPQRDNPCPFAPRRRLLGPRPGPGSVVCVTS